MIRNLYWFFIDTPGGFLTIVSGLFLLFIVCCVFQPEKNFLETSGIGYDLLNNWSVEPELKDDIAAAWADKFVSVNEYNHIEDKHSRLKDIRLKAKFRQTMTTAENLNFDNITNKGTDRD